MNMNASRRTFLLGIAAVPIATHAFAGSLAPPITSLGYSPDGKRIVGGSQAGISIHDSATGRVIEMIDLNMDNVHDVAFSPDGKTLIVAGGNPGETGAVELRSWPTLERQNKIILHDDVIYSVDFSADGTRWVAASGDEVCSVYNIKAEDPLCRFTQHSRGVLSCVFLPDGKTIVSCSRDETLRVWNASTGENIRDLHNHSRDVLDLAVRQTDSGLPMVASASGDLTVRFWQPTIGRMVRFARLPSKPLCIAWCGRDKLVAGCSDGSVRLINSDTVEIERTYSVAPDWIHSIAVDPTDDRRVACGTSDGKINTIDLAIHSVGR